MKGARRYASLFETGQYGKLYLVSGHHPRGSTFHVFILPEGEEAISNGTNNPPLNEDAVEVYGIVSGQPGWTESYGWLHDGKWQSDFAKLIDNKEQEIKLKTQNQIEIYEHNKRLIGMRISALLSEYT